MSNPRTGQKGMALEEILKAYFWQAGYFVVRSVPYRFEDEDITDVDLWLYERPAAATRRRLIVDIKNRRSPKAAERIIWTRGLQMALGVDGAIVATTDKRIGARRLAKSVGVMLFDGDAVTKITQSKVLKTAEQIPLEDLNAAIKRTDDGRRSSDWRQTVHDARSSLIVGFGVQATNRNLRASAYFAEQAALAQPNSAQAELAVRLLFHTSALAAISLDFLLADYAFHSQDERRQLIIQGIRFGESEGVPALATVRAAIALARKYQENGAAAAKQIEHGFYDDAERIPADIIADYVARISTSDALFNVARELERASSAAALPSLDELSVEAKSLLGAFLDFNGIAREKVALAWHLKAAVSGVGSRRNTTPAPLFDEKN
jgi:hypothetical protein